MYICITAITVSTRSCNMQCQVDTEVHTGTVFYNIKLCSAIFFQSTCCYDKAI